MDINYKPLIFMYKHYNALLFGWVIFAGIIYILVNPALPALFDSPLSVLLYIFIVIILFYLAVPLNITTLTNKIHNILFVKCDPDSYNNIYEDIVSQLSAMKRFPRLMYFYVNLSAGLIAAGKYNEAFKTLDKYKLSANNHIGRLFNVVYYNNLLSACLDAGMIKEAENNLDYLIKSIALLKHREYTKFERHLKSAQYNVNIAQGVYDYTEKVFTDLFDTAEKNYERINSKFVLAKIHLHFGDVPRAKEALEYVIAHGNKLNIVEEAKEKLSHFQQ